MKLKSLRRISLFRTGIKNRAVIPLKNIPIDAVVMPEPLTWERQLNDIRKAMPGVEVYGIKKPGSSPVDPEVQKMYAPLH